jgi:ABC-type Na+ efflux pump permease subunit
VVFVSPVSRYAIVLGKIMGEAVVALAPGLGVLASPLTNLATMGVLFVVYLVVGTFLFVRKERNR